uniref:Uncharacterized protein n=1 Tax=Craspedostauros australis TaxID=1486917 RepID=A0A7R9ZTC4_9STRA|mmetsp:Transcript_9467/g.25712  ORF Transcript_9467/g.25712 Transcript_9467/m.25712 type:complete len:422 (+) Transcript_9467:137-1402(+)
MSSQAHLTEAAPTAAPAIIPGAQERNDSASTNVCDRDDVTETLDLAQTTSAELDSVVLRQSKPQYRSLTSRTSSSMDRFEDQREEESEGSHLRFRTANENATTTTTTAEQTGTIIDDTPTDDGAALALSNLSLAHRSDINSNTGSKGNTTTDNINDISKNSFEGEDILQLPITPLPIEKDTSTTMLKARADWLRPIPTSRNDGTVDTAFPTTPSCASASTLSSTASSFSQQEQQQQQVDSRVISESAEETKTSTDTETDSDIRRLILAGPPCLPALDHTDLPKSNRASSNGATISQRLSSSPNRRPLPRLGLIQRSYAWDSLELPNAAIAMPPSASRRRLYRPSHTDIAAVTPRSMPISVASPTSTMADEVFARTSSPSTTTMIYWEAKVSEQEEWLSPCITRQQQHHHHSIYQTPPSAAV